MTLKVDDQARGGSVSSAQRGASPLTVFAAPTTGAEFNTLGERLVPKACFKVEDLLFDFDSSFVQPEIESHLPRLAQLRKDNTVGALSPPFSVFGHADPVGNDADNKKLSGRRATAIYAMLVRDVDLWETLFSSPLGHDNWGTRAIQTMLSRVQEPITVNGQMQGETRAAIKAFQAANGLAADGDAGPKTRKILFLAYMDALCGPDLLLDKATDFLARNADGPGGKGDFQGCSEFNPLMLFSKQEAAAFEKTFDKTERNRENAPNRRVMILLFAAGRRVNPGVWPCPRVSEGVAECKKRFFPDEAARRSFQAERREFDTTKDTFGCRFYQIISDDSPCEKVNPVPIQPDVNPLIILGGQTFRGTRSGIVGDAPQVTGQNFVIVKKTYTKPARVPVTLRSDRPFDGTGRFTFSDNGNIKFFPDADTILVMKFDEAQNVFTGEQLTAGVTVFAEGIKASQTVDDVELTLVLSPKLATIPGVARARMTVLDVTLDIFEPRTDPAKDPPPLAQPPATTPADDGKAKDKVFGGRFVRTQDAGKTQERAMVVVRMRPADFSTTLELSSNKNTISVFDVENPATPGAASALPLPFASSTVPAATGRRFFIEGVSALSTALRDVQLRVGVKGAEPECDRVSVTVVPALILRTFAPVACPGLDFRIEAVTTAVGTFSWAATGGLGRFVDAAGAAVAVPTTNIVLLRSFEPDNKAGEMPERKVLVTLTFTSGGLAIPYTLNVTVHRIQFAVASMVVTPGVTRADETTSPTAVILGNAPGVATMATNPTVTITVAGTCPQPNVCASNHRVGWLQTVRTNQRDLRHTDTLTQVTVPLPIRDALTPPVGPAPFYGAVARFSANNDVQTANHNDSPRQGANYVDGRAGAPAPPPAVRLQLRGISFSNAFTAWLTIQNLSWNNIDPNRSFLFLRNFDWSMQLNVTVNTAAAVGSRATPVQNPPTIGTVGNGQGGNTPNLAAPVANTANITTVNPAAPLP